MGVLKGLPPFPFEYLGSVGGGEGERLGELKPEELIGS